MQTANQPTVSSSTFVLCGQETVACIFVKKALVAVILHDKLF